MFGELLVVFAIDHEVEHWLEVTLGHGGEVEEESVEGFEHDWGFLWRQPHLVLLGHMEAFDGGHDKLGLVPDDNLVLILMGDLSKVAGHL